MEGVQNVIKRTDIYCIFMSTTLSGTDIPWQGAVIHDVISEEDGSLVSLKYVHLTISWCDSYY